MAVNKYQKYSSCILIFWFLYALIRYVVFKGVSPSHIPLYIMNKAVALTATCLLAITIFCSVSQKRKKEARHWGKASITFAAAHAMMSALLIRPAYFPKHFSNGDLAMMGFAMELSLLFSITALLLMFRLLRNKSSSGDVYSLKRKRTLTALTLLLIVFHIMPLGWKSWLEPQTWPGLMPPLTLCGAIIAILGLVVYIKSSQRK